ncbi:hypothetical protein SDC9_80574 [bioreactor metagenome]|uniref:Uncharacterized protein n=1 Tax=bioreactor metagenome TaxID=1076179 RepID=A0A644Z5I4_9ZZZZ
MQRAGIGDGVIAVFACDSCQRGAVGQRHLHGRAGFCMAGNGILAVDGIDRRNVRSHRIHSRNGGVTLNAIGIAHHHGHFISVLQPGIGNAEAPVLTGHGRHGRAIREGDGHARSRFRHAGDRLGGVQRINGRSNRLGGVCAARAPARRARQQRRHARSPRRHQRQAGVARFGHRQQWFDGVDVGVAEGQDALTCTQRRQPEPLDIIAQHQLALLVTLLGEKSTDGDHLSVLQLNNKIVTFANDLLHIRPGDTKLHHRRLRQTDIRR